MQMAVLARSFTVRTMIGGIRRRAFDAGQEMRFGEGGCYDLTEIYLPDVSNPTVLS